MAVDPTRLIPVVPIADVSSPHVTPSAKDDAGSFTDVLTRNERPTPSDKGSRDKASSWRADKPIEKVYPRTNPETNAPAAEGSPTMVNPDAPPTTAPPATVDETTTETQTASETDAAAQAAVIAATVVVPPTPLATTQTATAAATDTMVNPDAVAENPAVIAPTVIAPVPPVPRQVVPVAPQVASAPTAATVDPDASANAPQMEKAFCAKPAEETPPPASPDPVAPSEEPQQTLPQAEKSNAEKSPSTTAESADAAAPTEKPLSKAEKKDEREDHREKDKKDEVEPTSATEGLTPSSIAETNSAARGERATDDLAPPPDAAQAAPPVDAPSPPDAQPTVSGIADTSAPRFPPGLTGRATASREAAGRHEVDTTRFLRRVVGAFQAAEDRGGDVKLKLRPPELGVVQIQVKIQDGALVARMDAETATARNLLLDNLPQLRERLAEQGMRIEKFEVNVSDRQSGGMPDPGPQSRDQQSHSPRPSAPRTTARDEAPVRPPRIGPDQTGLNVLV